MIRIAPVTWLVPLLLVAACSTSAPRTPGPSSGGSTPSASVATTGSSSFLSTRRDYFSPPPRLTLTAWTERSAPTVSGETSVSVTVSVNAGDSSRLVFENPMLGLAVTGSGGRTPLTLRQHVLGPDGSALSGEVVAATIATVPAGSDTLSVTALVGPDLASARAGVHLDVAIRTIPLVQHVGLYSP